MNNTAAQSGSDIGVSGLLGVAFVVLKLTHVIGWSWWWVTAPFWAPPAIVLAIMVVAVAVAVRVRPEG